MKKRMVSLALALVFVCALVPAATAADSYVQLTPFKYSEIREYHDGMAAVGIGEWVEVKNDEGFVYVLEAKWGFVDTSGTEVVPCIYDYVENFSNGKAFVYSYDTYGKHIDKKGNEVEYKYEDRYDNEENNWYERIYTSTKMGLMDKDGEIFVKPIYTWIEPFVDGVAVVHIDGNYGLIDKNGTEIIPCEYSYIGTFVNGVAQAATDDGIGLINTTGAEVAPFVYGYIGPFVNGVAHVTRNGLSGLINNAGVEITAYLYSYIFPFKNGVARATKNGKYGLIDTTGAEITPCEHDYIESFRNGLARAYRYDGERYWHYFLDNTGAVAINCDYKSVGDFYGGLAWVFDYETNKYGFIDTAGKISIYFQYDSVNDFSEGLAIVFHKGQWKCIDTTGKVVFISRYDHTFNFSNGYAVVLNRNGSMAKYGLIDTTGREVIPVRYDGIQAITDGLAAVEEGKNELNPDTGKWEDNRKYALFAIGDLAPNLDTASDWAKGVIHQAVQSGFVPHDIQNNYTRTITRAEFCRMLVQWAEYVSDRSIDELLAEQGVKRDPNAFTDTNDADILAAYALGITSGTSNGKFTPNGSFTRQQAATMIMRTCELLGIGSATATADAYADIGNADDWAVEAINFCRANGIMQGVGGNRFEPVKAFTIQESIQTLCSIK